MRKFKGLIFVLIIIFLGVNQFVNPVSAEPEGTNPLAIVSRIPAVAWSRDVAAGGYRDGAPIGGFGAGTITWRFDGNFYQRLSTGSNNAWAEENCGFYMYQKSGTGKKIFTRLDSASLDTGQATYYSLFPKAWVDYHGTFFPCKARVTQFSPIIPGDYQRSSYPVGVYQWEFTNPTSAPCEIGIMLTWWNPAGNTAEIFSDPDDENTASSKRVGLTLRREGNQPATKESQIEYTLAGEERGNVKISCASASSLKKLVKDFKQDGLLNNCAGANKNGAIAITVKLAPGESAAVPIIIAWDVPISLDDTLGPNKRYKRYTRYFGRSGLNSRQIAREALDNFELWEKAVAGWQSAVINNPKYPDWLKSALFNELYYYFIGFRTGR